MALINVKQTGLDHAAGPLDKRYRQYRIGDQDPEQLICLRSGAMVVARLRNRQKDQNDYQEQIEPHDSQKG